MRLRYAAAVALFVCSFFGGVSAGYAGPRLDKINDRFTGSIPPSPVIDLMIEALDWRVDMWGGYEDFSESGSGWVSPKIRTNGPTGGINVVLGVYDRLYTRAFVATATPVPFVAGGLQLGYQLLVGTLSDSSLTLSLGLSSVSVDGSPALLTHFSGHWAKQLDRDLWKSGTVFRHQVVAGMDFGYFLKDWHPLGERGLAATRIGAGWEFCFDGIRLGIIIDGSAQGNLRASVGLGYRPWEGNPVPPAAVTAVRPEASADKAAPQD